MTRTKQIRPARERYHPCATGVHVCGVDEAADEPTTVANFPTMGRRSAEALFGLLKAEFEAEADEPTDLVVDLCVGGDIDRDFSMTRQMLERLTRAATEARP